MRCVAAVKELKGLRLQDGSVGSRTELRVRFPLHVSPFSLSLSLSLSLSPPPPPPDWEREREGDGYEASLK